MQKNEILEFIQKIDNEVHKKFSGQLNKNEFERKIFGKSALILSGLHDSIGTKNIALTLETIAFLRSMNLYTA